MRALAEGVRVFAASLVLSARARDQLPAALPHLWLWSIVIVGVLTLVYTFEGGIARRHLDRSDSVRHLHRRLDSRGLRAGPSHARRLERHHRRRRRAAGKLQLFSFSWDLHRAVHVLGGPHRRHVPHHASHGTDQLLVQRLLTCKNLRDSQKAIITSGVHRARAVRAVPRHRHHAVRLLPARAAAGAHDQRRDLSDVHRAPRCRTGSPASSSPRSSRPRCRT